MFTGGRGERKAERAKRREENLTATVDDLVGGELARMALSEGPQTRDMQDDYFITKSEYQ